MSLFTIGLRSNFLG
jgi:hypothetical protein